MDDRRKSRAAKDCRGFSKVVEFTVSKDKFYRKDGYFLEASEFNLTLFSSFVKRCLLQHMFCKVHTVSNRSSFFWMFPHSDMDHGL